jgi:hypothetical protein
MPNYDDIVAGMSAPPAANKWDGAVQMLDDQQRDAGSRAALAVGMASTGNPDQAALHNALAKRYNTTPEVVAAYPQEFKDRMAVELARSNMQDAPQLQQRIANQPQVVSVVHDDIPNAAGVERAVTVGPGSALGYIFNNNAAGEAGAEAVKGLGGAFNKAAGSLNLVLGAFPAAYDALTGGNTADAWFREMVEPRLNAAPTFAPAKDAPFVAKASNMAGNLLGMLSQITLGGTTAAPGAAPLGVQTTGQVLAGAVEHGAKAMMFPSLSDAVDTGRNIYAATGNPALAAKAAQISYLTSTAQGVIPLSAPGNIATRILSGFASGSAMGEVQRQAMNQVLPANMAEGFDPEQAILSGLAGSVLAVGGPRGERPGYLDAVRETYRAAQQADAAQDAFQRMSTLGQLSAASKWRERDPEGFHDFVRAVTEDGELPHVYIEGKAFAQGLQQAGVRPEELARTLPEVVQQLREAQLTEGFVRIPTADYASLIAGTPLDKAILPELKADPQGMNFREAQAFYQDAAQRMQEQAAGIAKDKQEADAMRESHGRVVQSLQDQLDALGRFSSDVNRVYANVQGAILSRLAAHEGITPEEAMAKYAPRLVAEHAGGGLDQAHPAGDIATTLLELGKHEGLFRFQKSTSKDISEIAKAKGLKVGPVDREDSADSEKWMLANATPEDGQSWMVTLPGGRHATITQRGSEVWINASALKEGSGGSRMYDLAANYAHNNGLTFIGDPAGVSEAAMRRRLENMLSSALKYGTTDHIAPHPDQEVGRLDVGIPALRWRKGDTLGNIRAMVDASIATTEAINPNATANVRYDPATQSFVDASGAALDHEAVSGMLGFDGRKPGTGAAGRTTVQRAALLRALLSGPDARRRVLESVRGGHGDGSAGLSGSFYQDTVAPRGVFAPESRTLALLKDADLSTYLHETGHWALDTYARIASTPDAPPEIRADMDRVLKWFGVESLQKWNSMSVDEQRDSHERFARAFEAYLMEGKAPSRELQPFFQRIRSWMVNIYRSLRGLNVELSPEVRQMFDRMLASDEAIREAQAARVFEPLLKEKPAGVSAEEWARYQDLGAEATNEAIEDMQRKSLRDMKWLSGAKAEAVRDLQKQAKTARDAITREVEEQVGNEPVYRLQDFLKGKKLKDFDPQQLAEMFGFKDGAELERALAEAPPRKEVIAGLVDRYMIERHGELSSPDAIDAAASEAVHNDARARFMATGLKILTKSPIPAAQLVRGAKEAAYAAIGEQRIRDLSTRQYEAAETKANRDALKAVAKDPLAAAQAQRAALLNNQLVKAAQEAVADVAKGLDYLKKFTKDSVREKVQLEFRDQIDALLARFDLRTGLSPEQAAEKNMLSLEAFVEKLAAMKFSVDVPESMILDANRKHYKDMTVTEFRGLIDAVKSLEHLGREVQKVQDGNESRMLADVAQEAVAQLEKLPKRTTETNRGLSRVDEKWISLKSFARSVQASLLKMEQMIDWLDDYNPNGVFNRLVFRKIADAEGRRNDLDLKIGQAWEAAVAKLPADVVKANRGKGYELPVIDGLTGKPQRLTWGEKIALAGIRGDAEHFSKLLRGEKWDAAAVLEFLDRNMTKAEWDFVEKIAGTFQELFPLKQQMLREMGSTAPKKVPRIGFQTAHGERTGWYWPITYDPARSHSVAERHAKHLDSLFEDNIYTRADTSTGREQTRNDNYAKPMLLSIDVLPRVLKDEIRDITTRRAIIEADRFLSHRAVREGIEATLSKEHYKQFNGWLLSLANDAAVRPSELQMWDRLAHELRTRATMVGLGFRISTMIMHGTTAAGESVAEAGFKTMGKGIFNKKTWAGVMKQLGPEWLDKGLQAFSRDGQWEANSTFIAERSTEMRHRMNEIERDVREQLRDIHLKLADPATGALQRAKLAIEQRAYQGIAMLDYASAAPTWMGAYLKAMTPKAKGGLEMGEQDAIYFADKTVRNAHGGGGVKDMAAIQRGNEFQKLFTMFYTFWNHNINRIIDTSKRVRELPAGFADARETGDWAGFRGDVGTLILRSFMYTLGVQAIHHMMHPPKEEEGEEGWIKWFAKQMAMSASGGVPILRDIAGHYAGGKDYEMSPVASVVSNTDRLLADFKDGSTHERWIKHAMTEAGYILGMPLGQPGSTVQFLADVWNGKQHPEDIAEWWRGITTGDMHAHQ